MADLSGQERVSVVELPLESLPKIQQSPRGRDATEGKIKKEELRNAISGETPNAKYRRKTAKKTLTPQLMVCYLLRRHYALSQVRVS